MSVSEPAGKGPSEAVEPTAPDAAPAVSVDLAGDGELVPGTLVGEYVVESKLGQGGFGSVYAAVQPLIGKRAAIKVLARHLCLDPMHVERFIQEARSVNQIGHPNIVDVFAFGTLPDGRSYFVMEWLAGETLAARLRRGWLHVPEAIAILFQICDGLAAAHDKGIVHRDLKPENIFLVPVRNRRMLVKLLDFGIAKLLGFQDERVDRTAKGASPGTPSYMSPEQARGKDVDHRTDIYSLGVTAFEMVLGRLPFISEEVIDLLYQHVHATPPAPSTLRPDIPLQLERLILAMLEKRADRRPTLPNVEARLAELRESVLVPLGDSGPVALRALETVHSTGRHPPVAQTSGMGAPPEGTDALTPALKGPPRLLIGSTIALLSVAVLATVVKLRSPATPPPPPALSAPAPAPVREPPPAAPSPATLVVHVNTAEARIELDGTVLAAAAQEGRFPVASAGEHTLVVSAPHRRTLRRPVTLEAGAVVEVMVTLERAVAVTAPQRSAPPRAAPPRGATTHHDHDYMMDPFSKPKK